MNLENYRSDRFGQALFNTLMDGFERAQIEARRETEPSKKLFEQPSKSLGVAHPQSEPRR